MEPVIVVIAVVLDPAGGSCGWLLYQPRSN